MSNPRAAVSIQEYVAMQAKIAKLSGALQVFVSAYQKQAEPIGDSDLYDEQPRSVHVTLGDCRKAERILRENRDG